MLSLLAEQDTVFALNHVKRILGEIIIKINHLPVLPVHCVNEKETSEGSIL